MAKSEQLARRAGRRKILEFRKQRRQHFSTHGSDPEYFPRREMWRWNDRSETASSFSTLNHSPEAVSPPPASVLSPKEKARQGRRSTVSALLVHPHTTKARLEAHADGERRFSSATMDHKESIASLKKSAEFAKWKHEQDGASPEFAKFKAEQAQQKQQARAGGYHRRTDPGMYLAEYDRLKKNVLAKRPVAVPRNT